MDRVQPNGTWYCKCRAGARVVGVCSHIASILWYHGYARHKPHISYGVRNWGEHLEDASHVIDHTDSDQSVIEELDPTILLETRGGFRGGVPPKIRKAYVIQR